MSLNYPSVLGIIPARYQSSRFPGKALTDLCGKSMIRRVWEGAREAESLAGVLIATDDARIAEHCDSFGADVALTDPALPSGTDRIAAALQSRYERYDIVVNIQGDEPLLRGRVIDALIGALQENPSADVATPVKRIERYEDVDKPGIVKVAIAANGRALYFSRAPIPYTREAPDAGAAAEKIPEYWKHIGLYAYRAETLERFTSLPPSHLEKTEHLEQLRLLEDGANFTCVEIHDELVAVDSPEDAEKLRAIISGTNGKRV